MALVWVQVVGGARASEEFGKYWFNGEAELNRYALEQARYGELHAGEAVLIFVTEDFLPDEQVKSDSNDRAATGAWPILKLNFTKKFDTGIYSYSIMTSTFTPIDLDAHPRTLKTTTSAQEWCGQTWLQLNLRDDRYRVRGYSYFESEGDVETWVEAVWLEDEIWNRIRLAPASLPTGRVRLVPGGEQSRLRHRPVSVESAEAELVKRNDGTAVYTLHYADTGRRLSVQFRQSFPHEILGWEETTGTLTTRAHRTHVLRDAYWRHNHNADLPLRSELGLSTIAEPQK